MNCVSVCSTGPLQQGAKGWIANSRFADEILLLAAVSGHSGHFYGAGIKPLTSTPFKYGHLLRTLAVRGPYFESEIPKWAIITHFVFAYYIFIVAV
jgi:hypothetical protein